jgi:hypothetical protein
MKHPLLGWIVLAAVAGSAFAAAPTAKPEPSNVSPSPPGASVFFIEPADGATVPSTFTVKFGLKGMTIAPAGDDTPNSGHHHLLIDVDQMPDMRAPLPANEHVVHYGKGQTETQLTLPPGRHTLQLVFGNYLHIPQDPPLVSKEITVTVVK